MNRPTLTLAILLTAFAVTIAQSSDRFEPTIESLQAYECPEWFRDAKFGIYLHWGDYSVADQGEWYARKLYEEGGKDYEYHLEHYGHPSEFGYKDFNPHVESRELRPRCPIGVVQTRGCEILHAVRRPS